MIKLTFANTYNWKQIDFSNNYYLELNIDARDGLVNQFVKQNEEVKLVANNGQAVKEQVYNFEIYEMTFVLELDAALFLAKLKMIDIFKIDDIQPEEWDVEILDISGNNEQLRGIKITYKKYFEQKRTANEILSSANSAPEASNILVSGDLEISTTATGTYKYFDIDDDLEGTSTFQWFLADNESGYNLQVISGATSLTYDITTLQGGKCLMLQVTPIALTGELVGQAVQSSFYRIKGYILPYISAISITGIFAVGEEVTQDYTVVTPTGSVSATEQKQWLLADDSSGLNMQILFDISPLHLRLRFLGKYLAFRLTLTSVEVPIIETQTTDYTLIEVP